jgi:hypothetical protein
MYYVSALQQAVAATSIGGGIGGIGGGGIGGGGAGQ